MVPPESDAPCSLTVLVHTGERTGRLCFDKAEITLGKAPHCDIRLGREADEVHCILAVTRHGYVLEDLRSGEGTFVDDRPVTQAFVEPGQRIRAGWTTLEIVADGPPAVTD